MSRSSKEGLVISDKMDKTVVVQIERKFRHPKFEKVITRKSKAVAHDEDNNASIGDYVRIESSRPISKTKKWLLKEIIKTSN